jgi:hypothetical protein
MSEIRCYTIAQVREKLQLLAALDPRSAEAITAVVEELLALGPERLSQLSELSEQERQDMVRKAFKRHYRGDPPL